MGECARGFEDCLLDGLGGEPQGPVGVLLLEIRAQARKIGQLATVHVCLLLLVDGDSKDLAD